METNNNTKINTQWIIYILVWFFVGILGAHRFMAGKVSTGAAILLLLMIGYIANIFTLVLIAWIWWFVDGIIIAISKFEEKNGKVVKMRIPENETKTEL